MDVNGTPFHLLLGRDDWLADDVVVSAPDSLEWFESDQTLRLSELPFVFPDRHGDRDLGPTDRRGADRDRYGHWYWIGSNHDEILMLPKGAAEPSVFWPRAEAAGEEPSGGAFVAKDPPAGAAVERFSGLAVTDHHYLVVGLPDLPGVLIFDLHGGGSPSRYPWPGPIDPVDICRSHDGGVWILDNADPSSPGPSRYWGLDRHFNICNLTSVAMPDEIVGEFQPKVPPAESEDWATASFASPDMGADLAAIQAVAIEGVPDGSVLVLDAAAAEHGAVHRYRGADQVGVLPLSDLGGRPFDLAFLPAEDVTTGGTVYISERQGDQAFAFALDSGGDSLTRLNRFLPMRLFTGKGLVAAGGSVYYDMSDRWLPLVDWVRPRYVSEGTLVTGSFDAGQPDVRWHRLLIDGCIPPGAAVSVETRTANDPAALAARPWVPEPDLYLRGGGSEIAFHRYGDDSTPGSGTWELLFQAATGRYLQIRLSLTGNGRTTPRLWALRAYSPRFSYLDEYLPDVYREDRHSASFIDRYLASVEGMFTAFESRIENAHVLFDVTTLDSDYLAWLASWLGATIEPGWDEARLRLFIQHAFELFGQRGTRRGMIEAIRLATDPCPDSSIFDPANTSPFGVRIVERFRTRSTPGVVFGDPTELVGPRTIEIGAKWTLLDGRDEVDRRYREFLTKRYAPDPIAGVEAAWQRSIAVGSAGEIAEFYPPLTPDHERESADWREFVAAEMAVGYPDVTDDDLDEYRAFLFRRYRRASALNEAWGLLGASSIGSFDDVALPTARLPADGAPLQDWIQFASSHLPIQRAAHRFTVLVPIRPADDDAARSRLLDTVERVVENERPGHTAFEVKPYWAAFRVGEARVGLETIVGEGSRFVSIVLGRGRIAQSYLSGAHPWNVTDRTVVGRERVSNGHTR